MLQVTLFNGVESSHALNCKALKPGFEPAQKTNFERIKTPEKKKAMARTGIEPATQGFSVLCSTS